MRQFNSKTFVCFIDISGFKIELKNSIDGAVRMLDTFYSAGYRTLKEYPTLNGIFVSDSGIIFPDKGTPTERLEAVLRAVKEINLRMLKNNFLTTTSIAYGHLEYRKKFAFDRIKKNAILGNGYINAFLDSENDENKILAGQVRITKQLDEENPKKIIFDKLEFNKSTLRFLEDKNTHYYFHWYLSKHTDKKNANEVFMRFCQNKNYDKYDILKKELQELRAH
jgi:hypothetical protein